MIKMIDYLLEGTRVAMTSNGYAPRGCSIQFLDPSIKEPSHQKNVETLTKVYIALKFLKFNNNYYI